MVRREHLAWTLLALIGCTGRIGPKGDWGDGNLPNTDDPVGATAQRLVIETPARAAMIPATQGPTVRLSGHVVDARESDTLLVNGEPIALGGDGSFSIDVPAQWGPNIIEAEVTSNPPARAQRAFLYGEFASPDDFVRSALAFRINRDGIDDSDGELDDLASLVERSLAERELINLLPATYTFDAAVVGEVEVALDERSADPPEVQLSPRNGGVSATVRIPNVRIRHTMFIGCLFTTCTPTGTATADAVVVTGDIDLSLDGEMITATTRNATVELVNFRNEEDGTIASATQEVLEFFVPDLGHRIEELLQPEVAQAARADFALALSQLQLPDHLDLRPELEAQLELEQRFDSLDFSGSGAQLGLAVRMRGAAGGSDVGVGAPGWLRHGGDIGHYRTDPAFGVSASVDLLNQMLFATWVQGALVKDLPAGTIDLGARDLGPVHLSAMMPPVVAAEDKGSGFWLVAGDVLVDSTLDGVPLKLACSVVGHAILSVNAADNMAKIELAENPIIFAEMLEGPTDLPGTFFTSLVEELGPEQVRQLVQSIPLALPTLQLDGVAPSLAGRALRLAAPAEVVTGEPPSRLTLYGRFTAQ